MNIRQAATREDIATARTLFLEYAAWLKVDLCFQGFTAELDGLPGLYAPPHGRLLLAETQGRACGCVALRPLSDKVCEMKRLFVRPEARGTGLGRRLARLVIDEAQGIGYATMRLDTLASMLPAFRLYESLGFVRRPAYYDTPLADTVFMELALKPAPPRTP
jgi:putative acetyltransferase